MVLIDFVKRGYVMDINYVKQVMKEKKITQIQLSELSGIPIQTLRKIFAGYTPNPRIDTVEAIEKALGIKDQELQLSPEKQELVDLILQMDEESLKEALTILNYVTNK